MKQDFIKEEIIVNSGVFCPTCHKHLSYDTYLNQHLNKCHSDTVLNGELSTGTGSDPQMRTVFLIAISQRHESIPNYWNHRCSRKIY